MDVPFVNLVFQDAPHLRTSDRVAPAVQHTLQPSGNVLCGLTIRKFPEHFPNVHGILVRLEVPVIGVVPEVHALVRLDVALLRPFLVKPFEVLAQALALGLRHHRRKVELERISESSAYSLSGSIIFLKYIFLPFARYTNGIWFGNHTPYQLCG